MFGAGLLAQNLLVLAAAIPDAALLEALGPKHLTLASTATTLLTYAPLFATCFLVSYALLVVVVVRSLWPLVREGWHADEGATGWAFWLSQNVLTAAKGVLFPLHLSIYTRSWLRLLGMKVGRGIEMSTFSGLSPLVSFSDTSFAADEVFYASARARDGWLHVSPIHVGEGTFLGNGAILKGGTKLGKNSLVGIETEAPVASADGTSWFGCPALELPRVPDAVDPSRSTNPPLRLKLARALFDTVRFLLPATATVALGGLVLLTVSWIAAHAGVLILATALPFVLFGAGLIAIGLTIAAKWLIMGRYRPGDHPFWTFFVWRDEIVNSCQEQLAGAWLLNSALGTPLMSAYLRAMGTKVGKDVWCGTFTITEFDLVELGDGCVINRGACVMTHLVHDRLLRLGPTKLGRGSTMGPVAAVLPDTELGAGCSLGWRSVVMRGEQLPPGTRWHGSPVVSA
jgi:non-ribosomal peptide synthetase-like protein